ncbi:hypothetical protein AGMMS50239_39420 [Bacteroidia bacterium]|nr:hypothetical protein AGMMS50239_39420 [Bacteroidia bacterium]
MHIDKEVFETWMRRIMESELLALGLLNALRKSNILFHCRIKEIYHYKQAEVYRMKTDKIKISRMKC